MFASPLSRLIRPKTEPEDAVLMRVFVGLAVMVSIVALISQDIIGTEVAVLVLILAPLGFGLSYLRRHRRNIVLKVVLSAFAIMILGRFLASLGGVTSVEG
ncbi:MAG: hypothetical protein ABIS18_02275, partial [Actinomycetota bacterium]